MLIRNTTSGLEVEGQGPINDIEAPATYDPYTNKLTMTGGGSQVSAGSLTQLENYFNSAVQVAADPDAGGGDDTPALQAQIALLDANGGGTLFLQPKTYKCTGLIPCDNLKIAGASWASVLKRGAGGGDAGVLDRNYLDAIKSNIILRDFKIDGNKDVVGTGRGINLEAVKNVTIDNVWAVNSEQGNIHLGHPNGSHSAGFYKVINCLSQDAGRSPNGWGNISAAGGDKLIFTGNTCTNESGSSAYSIDVEVNDTWLSESVLIANNICDKGGIIAIAITDGGLRDVDIIGNQVNGFSAAGNGPSILTNRVIGRCNILGNQVRAPNSVSPAIQGGGDVGTEALLEILVIGENTVSELDSNQDTWPNHVGIWASQSLLYVVRNNHVSANAPTHATIRAGIHIVHPDVNKRIFGNTFHNITVKMSAGNFQNGDIVPTADLPAASSGMVGLDIIEDAGSGVYHRINYVTAALRLRDLVSF